MHSMLHQHFRDCYGSTFTPYWASTCAQMGAGLKIKPSANLRRDLEPNELAMAYAALARMKPGGNGSNQHRAIEQICPLPDKEVSPIGGTEAVPIGTTTTDRESAAQKAGVPVRTMARAMAVDRRGSPELIEAVKAGTGSVTVAQCQYRVRTSPLA